MIKDPSTIEKPLKGTILYNQLIRYIKIGAFLHLMSFLAIAVFMTSLKVCLVYFEYQQAGLGYFWAFVSLWFFTIPFFAQFDAYGRYQNYKQIKDVLYEMGYDARLIKPFMYSKCQRDAVIVAAEDLHHQKVVKDYFYAMGYRRIHILPDAFNRNPLVLFNKLFWKRILFTEYYQLRNFYW